MGYIKEPEGVDFMIKSESLTDKARQEISDFIRSYKEKQAKKQKMKPAKSAAERV